MTACDHTVKSSLEVHGDDVKMRPLAWLFVMVQPHLLQWCQCWAAREWASTVWWLCQHSRKDGAAVGTAIKSIHEGELTVNDLGVYVWKKGAKTSRECRTANRCRRTRLEVVVRCKDCWVQVCEGVSWKVRDSTRVGNAWNWGKGVLYTHRG